MVNNYVIGDLLQFVSCVNLRYMLRIPNVLNVVCHILASSDSWQSNFYNVAECICNQGFKCNDGQVFTWPFGYSTSIVCWVGIMTVSCSNIYNVLRIPYKNACISYQSNTMRFNKRTHLTYIKTHIAYNKITCFIQQTDHLFHWHFES